MDCKYCGGTGWYPAFGQSCPYCGGGGDELERVKEYLEEQGFVLVKEEPEMLEFEGIDMRHGIHYFIIIRYSPERALYTVNVAAESLEHPERKGGKVFNARPGELFELIKTIVMEIKREVVR